jgi:hypothetical protein
MTGEPADTVELPANVRLLLHVAALRLENKLLKQEIADLSARLTRLESDRAE